MWEEIKIVNCTFFETSTTITRGAFSQLLKPGLAKQMHAAMYPGKVFFVDEVDDLIREEIEFMALVNPDTSQVPIWRRPPKRMEHPIRAWRCWNLSVETQSWRDFEKDKQEIHCKAILVSVSAPTVWEGPVIRAHKRPVDPKHWDEIKKQTGNDYEWRAEAAEVIQGAGIWALKTKDECLKIRHEYHATVYGEVDLWGRIAQFRLGYRAEACMIRSLFLNRGNLPMMQPRRWKDRDVANAASKIMHQEIIKQLNQRYGVEVVLV